MDTKLTLKLDGQIIDKAKEYAAKQNVSLSRIVEAYLQSIVGNQELDTFEISPFIKSLATGVEVPVDFDYQKEYANHLLEKYK